MDRFLFWFEGAAIALLCGIAVAIGVHFTEPNGEKLQPMIHVSGNPTVTPTKTPVRLYAGRTNIEIYSWSETSGKWVLVQSGIVFTQGGKNVER